MFKPLYSGCNLVKNGNSVRLISLLHSKQNEFQPSHDSYTPIYRYPNIRVLSLVNRWKYYQTVLAAVAIPGSVILQQVNLIDSETVSTVAVLNLSMCTVLHTLGLAINKFVGFAYFNEEKNFVKMSYVDYWGRRKDSEMPLEDIVPLSEVPASFTDILYVKFCRYSNKKPLKISLKWGQVLDREKYNKVFGKY